MNVCIWLCSYDLDLDPITLTQIFCYVAYLLIKNEISRSRFQKLEPRQERHRDRQTDIQTDATEHTTTSLWRVVDIINSTFPAVLTVELTHRRAAWASQCTKRNMLTIQTIHLPA